MAEFESKAVSAERFDRRHPEAVFALCPAAYWKRPNGKEVIAGSPVVPPDARLVIPTVDGLRYVADGDYVVLDGEGYHTMTPTKFGATYGTSTGGGTGDTGSSDPLATWPDTDPLLSIGHLGAMVPVGKADVLLAERLGNGNLHIVTRPVDVALANMTVEVVETVGDRVTCTASVTDIMLDIEANERIGGLAEGESIMPLLGSNVSFPMALMGGNGFTSDFIYPVEVDSQGVFARLLRLGFVGTDSGKVSVDVIVAPAAPQ